MTKDPFKYFCIFLFVCYCLYLAYNHYFPTTYVYIDYDTNIFHKSQVCDRIEGMQVLEEIGEVTGSEKIDKKKVYYDRKYKMCDYCFSPFEIESREEYIKKE